MTPLLIPEEKIKQLVQPKKIFHDLSLAFQEYGKTDLKLGQRIRIPLPSKGTAMVLFPGLLSSIPAYTVKVHAKFPMQQPAIKGVILLHDLVQGNLLAILDSPYLTAVRTGLTGALATNVLACKEAKQVAIIGAGRQAEFQLRFLPWIRTLEKVRIYDIDPNQAQKLAGILQAESNFPIQVVFSVEQAVSQADMIVTATWAKEPFLFSSMVKPGAHITVLGSDEPGKQEISAELIQKSLFVCDDQKLNEEMGAIASAGLTASCIYAELGEILRKEKPGRSHDKQITIFNGVGLPFQDLVAAWQVYQNFLPIYSTLSP